MKPGWLHGAAAITLAMASVGCAGPNATKSLSPVAMAASAGFDLLPNPTAPRIDEAAAIRAAETAWSPPAGAVISARSYLAISTGPHGFAPAAVTADPSVSRLEAPMTGGEVPAQGPEGIGIPVWLVSYTHVDFTGPSQIGGGGPPHHHAVDILLDATTGIPLESFTSPGRA